MKASDFNKTHVPVATMARLWIDDLLPPKYDKFLYLDGDIEIAGRLDALLALPVPPRGFLAAADLPLLIGRDWGRSARDTHAYISKLNLRNPDDYFNAGVLLVDRAGGGTWLGTHFTTFIDSPSGAATTTKAPSMPRPNRSAAGCRWRGTIRLTSWQPPIPASGASRRRSGISPASPSPGTLPCSPGRTALDNHSI